MDKIYTDAKGDAFQMLIALEVKAKKHLHVTEASLTYQKACAYLHSINFNKEDGSLQHAFNTALNSYTSLGVMAKDLMTDQAMVDALQKLADHLPDRLREAIAVASRSSDNIERVCNKVSNAEMRRQSAKYRFIKLKGEITNTLANSDDEFQRKSITWQLSSCQPTKPALAVTPLPVGLLNEEALQAKLASLNQQTSELGFGPSPPSAIPQCEPCLSTADTTQAVAPAKVELANLKSKHDKEARD